MADYLEEARTLFTYTQRLRRDFHQHPELGFQEIRTAGIVARELNELGLEVTTGVGQTGVVALIEGVRPGPVVLLRFDMDALPIQEATGAEYASLNPGVMHACGHDGHTAIGLTVARMLAGQREALAGMVKFVLQPAVEGLGGAEAMVRDGVPGDPRPDCVLALHLWNDKPFGWLGITPGPVMAASDRFTSLISGKGGHGAAPHQTIDPVLAGAQVVSALQSIVARNVAPLKSSVGREADLGLAAEPGFRGRGHADDIPSPGPVGERFGLGRKGRAVDPDVRPAGMGLETQAGGRFIEDPGQAGANRLSQADVGDDPVAEERPRAPGPVEELVGQDDVPRADVLAEGADELTEMTRSTPSFLNPKMLAR